MSGPSVSRNYARASVFLAASRGTQMLRNIKLAFVPILPLATEFLKETELDTLRLDSTLQCRGSGGTSFLTHFQTPRYGACMTGSIVRHDPYRSIGIDNAKP